MLTIVNMVVFQFKSLFSEYKMTTHWHGKFKSNIVPVVYGRMNTELQLTKDKTQAVLTFKYEGLYRNNEIARFDIENWLDENNNLHIGVKNNGWFFSINYTVSSFSPTEIKGTYETSCPSDSGIFIIVPEDEPEPELASSSGCIIC